MAAPSEGAQAASGRASRLANAASLYLRSAAGQAIDWHPWGDEPFELARRLDRPVLLDIGASWCHWCHVMDEGTYADREVARILAEHFVAVKVDRDERPEVDRRYQREVNALSGEGGWPLTAFLTPGGEAFLGGTYFPPADGQGRPGFRRVLSEVARLWRDERATVDQNARGVRDALARIAGPSPAPVPELGAFVAEVRARVHESYDAVNGGFGFAPKFPHPGAVAFLLWDAFDTGHELSASRARETLLRMAEGGLYDHLGGGFHRYSVDEGWHIPHFEKMGIDNAHLLHAYVEGGRRFPEPVLREVVRGTLGFIVNVLGDPKGGFGSSQDADNAPGDDGGYFTWSRAELKAVLDPEELRLVARVFGIGSEGRMPHDPERNVLFRLMTPAEAAGAAPASAAEPERRFREAVAKLRAARDRRPTPAVDRALYAGLNGAFIRGLAAAGRWLGDGAGVALARRAADRFLDAALDAEKGVAHELREDGARGFGLLEDQGLFALGLAELAAATAEPRYAHAAARLLDLVHREFADPSGLFVDVAPRLYDGPVHGFGTEGSMTLEDTPHLSANAAVALAELRLWAATGDARWRERAEPLVRGLAARLGRAGLFASGAALAAGLIKTEPARVVVEGEGPEAQALFAEADALWHPNLVVFRGRPPPPFDLPEGLGSAPERAHARALVCFGTRCLAPVSEPGRLAELLRSGASSRPA